MPIDRGALDEQLRDIGEGERWWEQREFRDLPHVLFSEERIRGIINGRLLGPRLLKLLPPRPRVLPARPWLVVATDQRLICLRCVRFGRQHVEFRQGQITGMMHGGRIRTCQITLATVFGRYRIRIPKRDAFRFIGALAPLIPHPPTAVGRGAGGAGDAAPAPPPGAIGSVTGLSGFVSKVALLATADYASRSDLARVERMVERLESEIARFRQQVDFIEELLRNRDQGVPSLPRASGDS